jgi:hypothetical protein
MCYVSVVKIDGCQIANPDSLEVAVATVMRVARHAHHPARRKRRYDIPGRLISDKEVHRGQKIRVNSERISDQPGDLALTAEVGPARK